MEFLIRPIEIGDGKGINALRRMPGVFENILGIPSERVKRNEDFIVNMDSNQHQFVAVTKLENGEELLIGTAGLSVNANHRTRHLYCTVPINGLDLMLQPHFRKEGRYHRILSAVPVNHSHRTRSCKIPHLSLRTAESFVPSTQGTVPAT